MFVRHLEKLGIAALVVGCGLSGCSKEAEKPATETTEGTETAETAETEEAGEEKVANLVYVNWAEGIAYTHLAKVVLEDKMGYEVKLTAADVGPAYTSVAQGDQDAFMETWLPTLHKDYIEKFEGKLVDLGHVYEGTQSGLVVPAYVPITKISELKDHKDKFDGKITGIDAGAGIMNTTEEVIASYDLGFTLLPSSGPAMTSALKNAIDKEEWIVVTGWRPHWKFGRWDLKFLEQDEDKMVWKEGNIHITGRAGIKEDKPTLAAFLSSMMLTDEQLGDLMIKVNESDGKDVEDVARQWMADNEAVITAWVPAS
ncbi:glycine betaine ABC transporter substrate-binding protein [Haliangium ochraceum]|uniref:Substrate-binding region of ABC-type glycine betaine transport system n=1 Tax=Haliangium ochraceum (strain DSM 14365 / JCM 11303 / SMP-2) TaxID=502025 RepID=D0LZG8_HALO1|nr:glycine betaine ABC transporter substrate-binding protein [Haliangium ochraceum]ACY17947.1 Substrate-binding region of ABC-type glycine betaine transport system [Haliangium ochraceum DSM 14365]